MLLHFISSCVLLGHLMIAGRMYILYLFACVTNMLYSVLLRKFCHSRVVLILVWHINKYALIDHQDEISLWKLVIAIILIQELLKE